MTTASPKEVRRLSVAITATTAVIAAITIGFSAISATRFVANHGAPLWAAPLVGVAVDLAFVMSLSADATLARLGLPEPGGWPRALRWVTGTASLGLNTGQAIADRDWTAVAVHAVAPLLLALLAEAGPAYRRVLAGALPTPESAPAVIPTPHPEAVPVAPVADPDGGYDAGTPEVTPDRTPSALPADLIRKARKIDERAVRDTGKPASIRALRAELRVGQDRAKAVRLAIGGAQ